MHMCFCVLLYFIACMLYYCNTVGWAWWDWGLIWWLTILLQCFDTVGLVTWPVKISSPNDLYCVEWDVKHYSTHSCLCIVNLMLCCAVWSGFPLPSTRQHRVLVIVWRLRGNIIRSALCWIVWHNVHCQQHTYMSSSSRSNRLGLSHWDPYAVCRGGCLELYYCNMVEWFWWDSSLISRTNWFPSVLWHSWFGHLSGKNRPRNDL